MRRQKEEKRKKASQSIFQTVVCQFPVIERHRNLWTNCSHQSFLIAIAGARLPLKRPFGMLSIFCSFHCWAFFFSLFGFGEKKYSFIIFTFVCSLPFFLLLFVCSFVLLAIFEPEVLFLVSVIVGICGTDTKSGFILFSSLSLSLSPSLSSMSC